MSMEIWVLSDRQLKSTAEWQAAIGAEGYTLRLASDATFETLRGFFPMQLRGERSGCECHHASAAELMAEYADIDFDHAWKYALGFRWGGDLNAMMAAWMAATAYAQATDGVVFDDQEAKLRSVVEAREVVEDAERDLPAIEQLVQQLTSKPGRDT